MAFYNSSVFTRRTLIIAIVALVAVIAIVVISTAVLTADKEVPVSAEYITVTLESESCAFLQLSTVDYSVKDATVLNNTDSDLIKDITGSGFLPFKQSAKLYLRNIVAAQKMGTTDKDVILISVESLSESAYATICAQFKDALQEIGYSTQVYCMYIKVKSSDIQKLADDNKTSYAKAYLATKFAEQSKKLSVKELIKLSVPGIINSLTQAEPEKQAQDVLDEFNEDQYNIILDDPVTSAVSSEPEVSSEPTGPSSYTPPHYIVSSEDNSGWLPILF